MDIQDASAVKSASSLHAAGAETPSGKGAGDENFPVGSVLLPAHLRPVIASFYGFARAADDLSLIHIWVLDRQPDHRQSGAEWVLGSVTDEPTVASACNGVARIIHLAAIPHLWSPDMRDFARVNHTGTQILLDAAKAQGVSAFVHVSSLTTRISGPVGGAPRPVTEADLPRLDDMLGVYPRSKWLAEQAARQAYDDGLPVRIAIPTMPLGPGDVGLTPPSKMVLD